MHDYSNLPLFSLQLETKEIPLSQGEVSIVDAADFEWLMQWKWTAIRNRQVWYAMRRVYLPNNKTRHIKMHREIIGARDGELVDHVDGNGLDNRRANLRIATYQQNNRNARVRSGSMSGYKGVSWDNRSKRWRANIEVGGRKISLGYFDSPDVAARKYDQAAIERFGEFAWLNFSGDHHDE